MEEALSERLILFLICSTLGCGAKAVLLEGHDRRGREPFGIVRPDISCTANSDDMPDGRVGGRV
jgi:hypothetical protein